MLRLCQFYEPRRTLLIMPVQRLCDGELLDRRERNPLRDVALWNVEEGMKVQLYIAVVDGQLVQRAQGHKEPPGFVCEVRDVGVDSEMETVADIEAFDTGHLWVILDNPSSLGEGIRNRPNSTYTKLVLILTFVVNVNPEVQFEDSRIGRPEGEFGCEDGSGPCFEGDPLSRASGVLMDDRVPRIGKAECLLRIVIFLRELCVPRRWTQYVSCELVDESTTGHT